MIQLLHGSRFVWHCTYHGCCFYVGVILNVVQPCFMQCWCQSNRDVAVFYVMAAATGVQHLVQQPLSCCAIKPCRTQVL